MFKFLDEIIEIEELPLEVTEMYDVGMVDTPHTFFANDILVHNSAYIDAKPLIDDIELLNDHEILIKTQEISDEVTLFLNKAVVWFSKHCFNSNNNRLIFNQEKISKRAFWGQAKKRYAQLSIDFDNNNDIREKIDIKGFDNVRSSFPKMFRSIMKEIIVDILHDVSVKELNTKVHTFKKQYKDSNIFDIMLPTSVKEISKYKYGQKGTPVHVKSAQHYNQMLNLLKDDSIPPIVDGDKIVWAYLRTNPYGFETMALKGQGEDSQSLVEFVEKFIAREQIFEGTLMTKLNAIWEDLGWGNVILEDESEFF